MTLAEWKRIVSGLQERPPRKQAMAALHALLLRVSHGPRGRFSKDLVSDVLLRILERPRLLLTVRRPETYLRLLLRREQYVGLRRAALEARHLAHGAKTADPGAIGSDPPGPLVARLDLQRLLERAGDRLTDDDRKLLRLRFLEGQGLRAVAESLGISYDSAAARAFRLLAKLRACLEEEG